MRADERAAVADFGGGAITSGAGAQRPGATDDAIRLVHRVAACFGEGRMSGRCRHVMAPAVGPCVFGIALGHEGLVDQSDS